MYHVSTQAGRSYGNQYGFGSDWCRYGSTDRWSLHPECLLALVYVSIPYYLSEMSLDRRTLTKNASYFRLLHQLAHRGYCYRTASLCAHSRG
jgi:hypothetical protein